MNDTQKTLFVVLVFFLLFAIRAELADHADPYVYSIAQNVDTVAQSIQKISNCLTYERKTVRWRRCYIISVIAVFLLFSMVHTRLPSAKESLLYVFIIFIVIYVIWQQYVASISRNAVKIGQDNIEQLKQGLSKEKSYIFPWK